MEIPLFVVVLLIYVVPITCLFVGSWIVWKYWDKLIRIYNTARDVAKEKVAERKAKLAEKEEELRRQAEEESRLASENKRRLEEAMNDARAARAAAIKNTPMAVSGAYHPVGVSTFTSTPMYASGEYVMPKKEIISETPNLTWEQIEELREKAKTMDIEETKKLLDKMRNMPGVPGVRYYMEDLRQVPTKTYYS